MGTRSLTRVFDEGGRQLVNMYRQFDGYPEGMGKDLAKFLMPIAMVNGLAAGERGIANGMGCLAAQLVAHFKTEPGGIYLYPTEEADCGQDYEYHITCVEAKLSIEVHSLGRVLFKCSPAQYDDLLTTHEALTEEA